MKPISQEVIELHLKVVNMLLNKNISNYVSKRIEGTDFDTIVEYKLGEYKYQILIYGDGHLSLFKTSIEEPNNSDNLFISPMTIETLHELFK